jgi:hypothetical protein
MSGCGARTAAGSLEAVFESSDVERFGWILMEGLGDEAAEPRDIPDRSPRRDADPDHRTQPRRLPRLGPRTLRGELGG